MLKYKSLDLDEKERIDKIIKESKTMSSDYTFVSNFLWNNFLLLDLIDDKSFFSVFSKRFKAYLFPLLANQNDNYEKRLIKIIDSLREDATQKNLKFKLYGLTEDKKSKLEFLYPNKFNYILNRNSSDYIYNLSDLVNLKGKKYHGQKNLIHNFERNHIGWKYLPLKKEMFKECLELNMNWFKIKDNDDEILNYESSLSQMAFEYYDQLNLMGGAIVINDKIIGYTLGCQINDETLELIIEKGMIDYKGVYNILCQQFLMNLSKNYLYINREEDLGQENLRKAKLSLHPCKILDKYEAIWI